MLRHVGEYWCRGGGRRDARPISLSLVMVCLDSNLNVVSRDMDDECPGTGSVILFYFDYENVRSET